jgi:ribosomal protein L11 methyltransferase
MKPAAPIWRASVAVSPECEEKVAQLLQSILGQPAVTHFDLESGVITVSVYLADRQPGFGLRQQLNNALQGIPAKPPRARLRVRWAKLKAQDWAHSWKKHFRPLEIGKTLLVRPSWSKRSARAGQRVVVLDPGLSFGTGQHPTTGFCLSEIVRCRRPKSQQAFLDIGTGSGILAIAAAKLGYRPVEAFDYDPDAVRIAGRNALRNRVGHQVRIYAGDITKRNLCTRRTFDVVCANLISNLLLSEKEKLLSLVKADGRLVLAGILGSEFPEIIRAYSVMGLRLERNRSQGEWCSGTFTRRG